MATRPWGGEAPAGGGGGPGGPDNVAANAAYDPLNRMKSFQRGTVTAWSGSRPVAIGSPENISQSFGVSEKTNWIDNWVRTGSTPPRM